MFVARKPDLGPIVFVNFRISPDELFRCVTGAAGTRALYGS